MFHWLRFAIHAFVFPLHTADRGAALALQAVFLAKLCLALAPIVTLFVVAPGWRVFATLLGVITLFASLAFNRSCAAPLHWVGLVSTTLLASFLVRLPFLRWTAALPLLFLLFVPIPLHGLELSSRDDLRERCASNDGVPPRNVDSRLYVARYYGVHYFSPDWLFVTGENPIDGQFMGIPHHGTGSWWFRRKPDGEWSLAGPSQATGNVWTSCLLDGGRFYVRSGMIVRVKPPDAAGNESVERFPFPQSGFESVDTACDERTGTVYATDLLDSRLLQLQTRPPGEVRRRPDSLSARGGILFMRNDGRLVMFDVQDLVVYSPDESRVLQRLPAAVASNSMTVCPDDGAVAIPDFAGRLRLFRKGKDGVYSFDWAIDLFAPRFARFSPDCKYLAVTSGDDLHVWIVDRDLRTVVRQFRAGPAIRAGDFTGPREFTVADACVFTTLRF